MQSSLAITALVMGLVGGPHCVAMCGAACAGIGQVAGADKNRALLVFQLGRVLGYALLGGVAAASLQGFGWLTLHAAWLRPLWSMFHVAILVLGLVLVWRAQQPIWLEMVGRKVWSRARAIVGGRTRASLLLGVVWALLPCGLLYSALLVAAMAGSIGGGAMVMALFALGTSVTMWLGPLLWLRGGAAQGAWGMRLAGAVLAASAVWALWMGLFHNAAPWCVVP